MVVSLSTRMSLAGAALAAAFLFSGCASPGGDSDRGASPEPTETAKALTSSTLVGTWGSTDEQQPYLLFDEDGSITGSDGCNRIGGGWEMDGDTVVLSNLVGTLMACDGVDQWLREATSARLVSGEEDELQIFDRDNSEIGTLERAD